MPFTQKSLYTQLNLSSPFNLLYKLLKPIRPGISVVRQARGERSGCKKLRYHQPTEMKLCVSLYSHKSMPDAKFDSVSFSIFGNMTWQNWPLKKGTSHRIRVFTPAKWVYLKKSFYFQNCSSRPMSISSIFKQRKSFSFSKVLRHLNEKRTVATPWLINFAKNWSGHVLKIETTNHKVWVS